MCQGLRWELGTQTGMRDALSAHQEFLTHLGKEDLLYGIRLLQTPRALGIESARLTVTGVQGMLQERIGN